MVTLIPNRVNAFWPFSTNANAAGSSFAQNSSSSLLKAATNIDPNPDKGLDDSIQTSDNAMIAYAGILGSTADIDATPPDRISVYVVRPGDTLSEIAKMFDVSVNTIIWANNLSSAKDFHVGDTLIILPISGVKRVVAKGDTLKSVAKKYGADANEIAQFNGLDPADPLEVGSTLIIPGGEINTPVPVKRPSPSTDPYRGGGTIQTGYFSNPMPGSIITQGLHDWRAVDIGGARGTPIHAAADGIVIIARNNGGWNGGYGNYVVITHSNGTQTLYAHMKNTIVSPGQSVGNGQIIGFVGMTGHTTGPHLHFEVRGAANPFRSCRVGSVCNPQ
ncbi:MAG: M23 family metallopeptidase [Candidatus Kaiserbacteria bacterium]|nr:M23 family metallopeptidase [Candidatus Kaiserbacteria bacterium]